MEWKNLKQFFSENDFIKNEKRFFSRLKALGLLENKSDGYAYVVNIFEEKLWLLSILKK